MANLAPFPVFRAFDSVGKPLAGGLLHTRVAGTTTPKVSFTDSTGSVANTNPVVLNARGEANVWLDGSYSLLLQDANGITQWTVDNVTGVGTGDTSGGTVTADEWLDQPDSPTFVSSTQYTVPGDRTSVYHVGRRQRAQVSGGIAYSTITASVFATGATTVTVANDSVVLDGGISSLAVGINSADNPSISVDCIAGIGTLNTVLSGSISMWGTGTAPPGYLFCDGAAVSRTTYATLFGILGETWGAGDGVNTFNVPDLRNRAPVGFGALDGSGAAASLAVKQGVEEVALAQDNLPNITSRNPSATTQVVIADSITAFVAANANTNLGGNSTPFNIRGPELPVGFIIKT